MYLYKMNNYDRVHAVQYTDAFQNGLPLPVLKSHELLEDDIERESLTKQKEEVIENPIKERVESIKSMLGSMEDGEISISAYDTAWVALVEDIHGTGRPQFPSSLQWIAKNQLPDGSWGDGHFFFLL
jgi:ent-copalyl diphosphate synthase